MKNSQKKVLSGIQPTGDLHIGHYLGILNNFKKFQSKFECYFMIANLHSLTSCYPNYEMAHQHIFGIISDWLAMGIDPEKSVMFVQSDIPEHAELNLLLSMYTPVSWLMRNPIYKDKKKQINGDIDNLGFLGYPVLQAADILLYEADLVPIGEDQLPHLELTREIVRRFNHFNQNILKLPKAELSKFPKILGTDGRKMSKSYGNTINLSEPIETISQKIMKMQTDPARVRRNDPGNPDVCPVYSYYSFFNPKDESSIAADCRMAKIGCVDCKKNITKSVETALKPFREKRMETTNKPEKINQILKEGKEKAQKVARGTLEKIKDQISMKKDYLPI